MNIRQFLTATIALLTFSAGVSAADFQHSTPAAQGYDVVSYHVSKRPVRGNGNFVSVHDGATYQFSNKDNLKKFEKNPEKYVPAYGGYCAFGVAVGKKFVGDPEVWRVVDGTLYLNLDTNVQDRWFKDVPGNIKKADKNWAEIHDKAPASL